MNPFFYPKSKHRRRLQPSSYSSYTSFKPTLKEEFYSQCVYCRLPDGLKGSDAFGVDHYRPQSLFPALAAIYLNLFYACNCCNRRKGAFWPSNADSRAGRFIPNPCDHIMFDHLRYRAARVETRGPAGELADKKLMLNDEQSINYREFVLGLIGLAEDQKRQLEQTLRTIDEQLRLATGPMDQLRDERRAADSSYAKVVEYLSRLGATNQRY